jgi:peroxiredoxin
MRLNLFCLIAIMVIVCRVAHAALAPKVTDDNNGPAPAFTLKPLNYDGKEVSSADFKGKPLVLSFFASWCPPCEKQVAELIQIYKDEAPRGLAMIGAAADAKLVVETKPEDEIKDVKEFIKEKNIPYPLGIATDKIAKDFKFKGIPTTIFIDREGKIVKTFYGFHKKDEFKDVLKSILTEAKKE